MNKRDVFDYLKMLLGGILMHDLFFSEFLNLIAEKGFEERIFTLLTARLKLLTTWGYKVTCVKEFENIGQGLFSMHLTGAGFNIRVLFAFLSNNQPVLLHAFEEKQGKRRTDYSSHIPPALLRLSQTKEDFKNGFI